MPALEEATRAFVNPLRTPEWAQNPIIRSQTDLQRATDIKIEETIIDWRTRYQEAGKGVEQSVYEAIDRWIRKKPLSGDAVIIRKGMDQSRWREAQQLFLDSNDSMALLGELKARGVLRKDYVPDIFDSRIRGTAADPFSERVYQNVIHQSTKRGRRILNRHLLRKTEVLQEKGLANKNPFEYYPEYIEAMVRVEMRNQTTQFINQHILPRLEKTGTGPLSAHRFSLKMLERFRRDSHATTRVTDSIAQNLAAAWEGFPRQLQSPTVIEALKTPRLAERASAVWREITYSSNIGLAADTVVTNMTGVVNSWADKGTFNIAKGLKGFVTEAMKKEGRANLSFIADQNMRQFMNFEMEGRAFKRIFGDGTLAHNIWRAQFVGMKVTEIALRGIDFMSGLELAAKQGMELERGWFWAIRNARSSPGVSDLNISPKTWEGLRNVRRTQFAYGVMDISPYMQGPYVRALLPFRTYPLHHIGFMYDGMVGSMKALGRDVKDITRKPGVKQAKQLFDDSSRFLRFTVLLGALTYGLDELGEILGVDLRKFSLRSEIEQFMPFMIDERTGRAQILPFITESSLGRTIGDLYKAVSIRKGTFFQPDPIKQEEDNRRAWGTLKRGLRQFIPAGRFGAKVSDMAQALFEPGSPELLTIRDVKGDPIGNLKRSELTLFLLGFRPKASVTQRETRERAEKIIFKTPVEIMLQGFGPNDLENRAAEIKRILLDARDRDLPASVVKNVRAHIMKAARDAYRRGERDMVGEFLKMGQLSGAFTEKMNVSDLFIKSITLSEMRRKGREIQKGIIEGTWEYAGWEDIFGPEPDIPSRFIPEILPEPQEVERVPVLR